MGSAIASASGSGSAFTERSGNPKANIRITIPSGRQTILNVRSENISSWVCHGISIWFSLHQQTCLQEGKHHFSLPHFIMIPTPESGVLTISHQSGSKEATTTSYRSRLHTGGCLGSHPPLCLGSHPPSRLSRCN